ncbi:MAG: STAS domain-containing protein [Gammaproteobacteria bacterium]|nr:STAS domain-containing protein [Gammaproteobacteria bacterium]
MAYSIASKDNKIFVHLNGEIDLERSPEARKVLLECLENTQHLVVDLAEVDYIDSSGVASLVEALQTSRKKNIEFALTNLSDPAMKVLKLARLDKVFKII